MAKPKQKSAHKGKKSHPQGPKKPANQSRPQNRGKGNSEATLQAKSGDSRFFFGRNSILSALQNKRRKSFRLICLPKAQKQAQDLLAQTGNPATLEVVEDERLLRSVVPFDSPHQGLVLEAAPLPPMHLEEMTPSEGKNLILMLDQVTDPHNVGACLRAGAALGAKALITPDRNTPSENGTIARTAAGATESLPWIRVTNVAQALDQLKEMGYWSVGMDGDTDLNLSTVDVGDNIVLVMGSEGSGMRALTKKHCDIIAKIPMTDKVESLNVATAAAIGIYELGMRNNPK